jgi:anaerobic selenocysteine-containing dehydrogenase
MVVMGALQGIKPGEAVLKNASRSSNGRSFQVSVPDMQKHWKIIYLMGEACPEWLPPHDYLIYQNAFPPSSSCQPNLILPSALFTESVGTMVNVEGRLLHMDKAVEPPGESRPDWWVMGRLGEKLDGSSVAYTDVFAIHMEMKKYAKTFPDIKKRIAFAPFLSGDTGKGGPVRDSRPAVRPDVEDPSAVLTTDRKQEYYRGLALSDAVPGMKQIGERGDMPEIHREERQ